MNIPEIHWFEQVLDVAVRLYFRQECPVHSIYGVPEPADGVLAKACKVEPTFDERVVLTLALMPHLSPQVLDIFFASNKNIDRPYTEFGGWKGISHSGFLPTGQTAVFILAGNDEIKRGKVLEMFDRGHWFFRENILLLDGRGGGEPFLSGQLRVSEEFLSRVVWEREYKPDYEREFPAKRITTALEWEDLVLDYQVMSEIEEINVWLTGQHTVMEEWGLKRFLKAGYRALFYGPPGTGKTLTASLIGKRQDMDVYRVDLSMMVSKYIGETEKNLARIFDMAVNRRWILFFDEADALFGRRTSAESSNDRHANQEVAYLLQRIEDFPGMIVLATNLRSNIDEAFFRRFQAVIYFPIPDEEQRAQLWLKMLPPAWIDGNGADLIRRAAGHELSGGSISNVVRRCALQLLMSGNKRLTEEVLMNAIGKELYKEGKIK